MLLAALCGASLLYFARAWHDPSRTATSSGWAVFSALALLTHSFAVFLVAPEALWLLYVIRTRVSRDRRRRGRGRAGAAPAAAVHARHEQPARLHQLDAAEQADPAGAGRLRRWGRCIESPLVRYGLLGAAVLAAAVIVLLVDRVGCPAAARGRGRRRAGRRRHPRAARAGAARRGLLHTAGADARLDPARGRGRRGMHGAAGRASRAACSPPSCWRASCTPRSASRPTLSTSGPTGAGWPGRSGRRHRAAGRSSPTTARSRPTRWRPTCLASRGLRAARQPR